MTMMSPAHSGGVPQGTRTGVRTATLADVDITAALASRPTRAPDYEREHRAFDRLTAEMAGNPTNLLQCLVDVALDLCRPHSAGISLIEGNVFRWVAVAGVLASARGGTMPRHDSPCGLCVDRGATLLLHSAGRHFPALAGEPRFVEALLVPFYDGAAPIGSVWMVSHDVDRTFDREDERLIGVLSGFAAAAWRIMNAEAVAVSSRRRKAEFLAMVAHELRNPFSAILGAAALLQHIVVDDPRAARPTEVILQQTRHMSRLMEDLLDIERIERGKLQLDRRTMDLREVVAETIEMRRGQVERRGQVLTVELGTEPVLVHADQVRLAQMLSNLVDNASKYTPDLGLISIQVSSGRGHAVMAVRDSGAGVPVESVEDIFEPFAQLDGSGSQTAGGLGLGLALVRRLAELHGGTVEVASDGPGLGSCFTVRLPLGSAPGGIGRLVRARPARAVVQPAALPACSARDARESLAHARCDS